MTTTQERIKRDIVEELAWDARVLATDVRVDVADGSVTLSGTVSSHFSRRAAVEDARQVPGVLQVIDRLGVRSPEVAEIPTDERIQSNVENVLAWNPDIDIVEVKVEVSGGVVKLHGTVNAFWKKFVAENLVLGLSGVVGVENHLAIVPTESVSDQAVAENILRVMRRSRHVDPDRIDVVVEDGLVTLWGTVDTIDAEEAAFDAARNTRGVRGVRNELSVLGQAID